MPDILNNSLEITGDPIDDKQLFFLRFFSEVSIDDTVKTPEQIRKNRKVLNKVRKITNEVKDLSKSNDSDNGQAVGDTSNEIFAQVNRTVQGVPGLELLPSNLFTEMKPLIFDLVSDVWEEFAPFIKDTKGIVQGAYKGVKGVSLYKKATKVISVADSQGQMTLRVVRRKIKATALEDGLLEFSFNSATLVVNIVSLGTASPATAIARAAKSICQWCVNYIYRKITIARYKAFQKECLRMYLNKSTITGLACCTFFNKSIQDIPVVAMMWILHPLVSSKEEVLIGVLDLPAYKKRSLMKKHMRKLKYKFKKEPDKFATYAPGSELAGKIYKSYEKTRKFARKYITKSGIEFVTMDTIYVAYLAQIKDGVSYLNTSKDEFDKALSKKDKLKGKLKEVKEYL
ncbi:hypothetical protein IS519_03610 [Vibrio crassostreae]|uniref:hypothetical protein n=1 Tax=Vibrio TaxID=662 RepID=UPI001553B905|nr:MULTISPECIES: hypothetical protein [Vibrio]UPR30386.1 hypothetical protein IS519_03610 [Vibrio crassostreae]